MKLRGVCSAFLHITSIVLSLSNVAFAQLPPLTPPCDQLLLGYTAPPVQKRLPAPPVVKLITQFTSETVKQRTEELQKAFEEMYSAEEWARGNKETIMDYGRLIDQKLWGEGQAFPMEVYGQNTWFAFREADFYLKSIPVGEFKLTVEVVKEVHKNIVNGVFTGLRKLHFAGLPKTIFKKGGQLKTTRNFGFWSVFHNLSEKEYESIRSNPDLKFAELPGLLSQVGKRRGLILYSKPTEALDQLTELCQWVNESLKTRDPIEVAAIFQRRFVAIHPFQDGNGRTSRMIMDRILLEKDIAPPMLANHDQDLFSTEAEWIAEVRRGARKTTQFLEKRRLDYETGRASFNQSAAVAGGSFDPIPTSTSFLKYLQSNDFFEISGVRYRSGGGRSFLIDRFGVQHVYYQGRLIPVSDRTAKFLNAALVEPHTSWQKAKESTKKWIEEQRALTQKMIVADIPVDSYQAIRSANDGDRLLLPKAFEVDFLNSPVFKTNSSISNALELAPTANQTQMEAFLSQESTSVSSTVGGILAQFQKFQFELEQLAVDFAAAKTEYQTAAAYFLRQRMKHSQAWMTQYFTEMRAAWDLLGPQDQVLIWNMPLIEETFKYLRYTPFSKIMFDEPMLGNPDRYVYLLRSDSSQVAKLGIYSDAELHKLILLLPGARKLAESIIQDPKKFGEGFNEILNGLGGDEKKTLLQKIFGESTVVQALNDGIHSRYNRRSTEVQFRRKFVDFYMHASSSIGSQFISLSSSIDLYNSSFQNGNAQFSRDRDSAVYIVRVKKDDVFWNTYSTFSTEYEFLKSGKIKKSDIVEVMKPRDRSKEYLESRGLLTPEGLAFLQKYFNR